MDEPKNDTPTEQGFESSKQPDETEQPMEYEETPTESTNASDTPIEKQDTDNNDIQPPILEQPLTPPIMSINNDLDIELEDEKDTAKPKPAKKPAKDGDNLPAKKDYTTLIGLVVALIVAIVGYWLYNRNEKRKQQETIDTEHEELNADEYAGYDHRQ